MQNQNFKLIYIDAFAGAGWSKVRSSYPDISAIDLLLDDDLIAAEEEFIAGSPVRALSTGGGFDQHYFFDADPLRAKLLDDLKLQYPNKMIEVKVGDANVGVQALAKRFNVTPNARGVAFLDPYGPNLHWKTIQALAATGQVDVIINFPLAMAINRLITKNAEIPANWLRLLDDCFGTRDWYDLAYEKTTNLFGVDEIHKSQATAERLLAFYQKRLKDAFGNVVSPALVKNTKGLPLYYLMWAASNSRGAPIADHIMKLGERVKPPKI